MLHRHINRANLTIVGSCRLLVWGRIEANVPELSLANRVNQESYPCRTLRRKLTAF
jgi:hypothetical protein